jgi:SH3-like domain-containing protein
MRRRAPIALLLMPLWLLSASAIAAAPTPKKPSGKITSGKPASAKTAASKSKTQSVAVREANFRTGPSIKHDVAFTAIKFYPVKILKRVRGWVEVEDFEGDRAWIALRLLSVAPTVVVSVDKANLRGKASTKSEVVDKVEKSQVFRVVERKGRWLRLAADDDERGWIREDLVWGD